LKSSEYKDSYFNTEPLGMGIGGFDNTMQKLLKEYYKRYFNFFWGVVLPIMGINVINKILN